MPADLCCDVACMFPYTVYVFPCTFALPPRNLMYLVRLAACTVTPSTWMVVACGVILWLWYA